MDNILRYARQALQECPIQPTDRIQTDQCRLLRYYCQTFGPCVSDPPDAMQ